jgi:penicillin-binding protein 2
MLSGSGRGSRGAGRVRRRDFAKRRRQLLGRGAAISLVQGGGSAPLPIAGASTGAHTPGDAPELRPRLRWLLAIVVAAFALLLGRLWQLQIIRGDVYQRKSADNFVKDVEIPALRGRILDRAGGVLADNRPSFDVHVTPRFVTPLALARLRDLLVMSPQTFADLKKRVDEQRGLSRFRSLLVREDVGRDLLAVIEANRPELPGVTIDVSPHRTYPQKQLATHAVGYMNQVTGADLRRLRERAASEAGSSLETVRADSYRPGDYIGRTGIERAFERILRGTPGAERVVIDARGIRKSQEEAEDLLAGAPGRSEPHPGSDVVLTIDERVQLALERGLNRTAAGAAVVVEVRTGRILGWASRPALDLSHEDGQPHIDPEDPRRPLVDKNVREHYFPGSTFKVVTALAALGEKLVTPWERINCKGSYKFGGHVFRCMHVHKSVDMAEAISRSCNVYFYQLGERLGMDRLAQMARGMGFGEATGLGLNGEVPGLIPTVAWFKKTKEGFKPGYSLNASIGQGATKVTALQLALAYAAIANGGQLMQPQIVERVIAPDGTVSSQLTPMVRRRIDASAGHLALISRALRDVVHDREGTAHSAQPAGGLPVAVAGKTGTAQVRSNKGSVHGGGEGWAWRARPHAWFVGFAPADRPEIAFAVLVEHGGLGAKTAAPIAFAAVAARFGKGPLVRGTGGEGAEMPPGEPEPISDDDSVEGGDLPVEPGD